MHQDALAILNTSRSLTEKVAYLHGIIDREYAFVSHISTLVHDQASDHLQPIVTSTHGDAPASYQAHELSASDALSSCFRQCRADLFDHADPPDRSADDPYLTQLRQQGYRASYVLPMVQNHRFYGFVLFACREGECLNTPVLNQLDLFGHMIALLIINELQAIQTMQASVRTVLQVTHLRDPETGNHLQRMSRYARLIATDLARHHHLDDETIEHIFLFAPLHDIGKIGIPDYILLKPGKLTTQEYETMKTHAVKGRKIIDQMVENFGNDTFQHLDLLRNIVEYHHETISGNGYPSGLRGESIPLEARIVAVADVFDALTSERPYKRAWSNEKAFTWLHEAAGDRLDRECVQALSNHQDEVHVIQRQFRENPLG